MKNKTEDTLLEEEYVRHLAIPLKQCGRKDLVSSDFALAIFKFLIYEYIIQFQLNSKFICDQ